MPDSRLPRDGAPDSSFALWREGYNFIPRRCRRHGTDAFRTRLMLKEASCVQGADWAEMFYDGDRFTRRGGLPLSALTLLQDVGSVMTLDGAAHRHRKGLFLDILGPEAAYRLAQVARAEWERRLPDWESLRAVTLFDEMRELLFHAVCDWAGVPLGPEAPQRLYEVAEMVEASARVGPNNWRTHLLRARTEHWARQIIREARAGHSMPKGTALESIAQHRDEKGRRLPARIAAVELINVIRPTVAVARYIVFSALALHRRPEMVERLRTGDEAFAEAFAQEVRRLTPFIPMIGGRALRDFEWKDFHFSKGDWVLIDLFGTDRDPRLWDDPDGFRPERFLDRIPGPYDLIPQGAGDHATTHRCPGEWIAQELTKMGAQMLASLDYQVPSQDLSVDLSRIPAIPRSGFLIGQVRQATA
ncbi:cytochrome P450 [Rubellimicrobium roseum]|uniref:Cytochrome P450 n=1 Tax=Rubellimicrobium roseum TaxID=687525 RepID=A0A5C4NIW8_9RHOB|nr:cytochrome P450 [Rubellimicrobium roseum]TNC74774.1 cytochrome P450 [Rubellimicrobium roseum]